MNPEISIVISTYNRSSVLPRALDSVFRQKGVSFEVLVVDDGSTDGTAEMIRKKGDRLLLNIGSRNRSIGAVVPGTIKKKSSLSPFSVKYLRQENRGPASARNLGIRNARGEWIAFLDSDDEWLPGKLKTQIEFFRSNPEIRICQTEEIWIRNGRRVNPMNKHKKYGGWIFEKCLPLCIISPSAVMIHRNLFEETGLFDESFPACEDYELWLRITSRHAVGLISKPLIRKYGGHEDQLSKKFEAMDRFRIQALVKILKSGSLSTEQEALALKTLREKSEIYLEGAKKHNREEQAAQIQGLIEPYLAGPCTVKKFY